MAKSHIERILAKPNFKPYEGPDADVILKKVMSDIKIPPLSEERARAAVKSLSYLAGWEVEKMIEHQDSFCVRCGNCCRTSHPVDFLKYELKAVAERLGTSYKKLKRRLNARPSGRVGSITVIWVPGKPCQFLKGIAYCTIYDLRPMVCSLYPLGRTLANILAQKPVGLVNPNDCPAMWDILKLFAISRLVEESIENDK